MSALSPRQMFLLDQACHPINEALGSFGCYLVGTAAERGPFRDVDVRFIMADKKHDRLTKAIRQTGVSFLGIAIGQYLASLTGLPIDFQIQRQTEANALHDGIRNPLGHRSLDNYKGDAQTADMQRKLTELALDHEFLPVAAHPDDDECTYRSDGTDLTYCGEPESAHNLGAQADEPRVDGAVDR